MLSPNSKDRLFVVVLSFFGSRCTSLASVFDEIPPRSRARNRYKLPPSGRRSPRFSRPFVLVLRGGKTAASPVDRRMQSALFFPPRLPSSSFSKRGGSSRHLVENFEKVRLRVIVFFFLFVGQVDVGKDRLSKQCPVVRGGAWGRGGGGAAIIFNGSA